MASYTLAQLREAARERADQQYVAGVPETDKFVTDSELNGYVNRSISELYDLIISCYGNDYYVGSENISLISNQSAYALPVTFYQMLGVDLVINDNNFITLKPFMFQERNQTKGYPALSNSGGGYSYHLRGSEIVFQPTPMATNSVKLWFIPLAVVLVADSDTLQGFNGWEEYVIIDAAIKMAIKQENNVEELYRSKNDMVLRIKQMADNRDSGMPQRVQDVEYDVGFKKFF